MARCYPDDGEWRSDNMKTTKTPSLKTMERWLMDGVAKATDGCRVEPDGTCQHGAQSWLIVLGFI